MTGPRDHDGLPVACLGDGDLEQARRMLEAGEYFWLDLRASDDARINDAGELLGLHPLTIEDLQHFGQRPKIEPYAGEQGTDYVYIVFYGAAPRDDDDRLAEVHIVHSPNFLLTARNDESLTLTDLHARFDETAVNSVAMLHAVLDGLVDSFGPVLDELDDRIERLEELIFDRDLKHRDSEIHNMRRLIGKMNRTIHSEAEAFTRIRDALEALHGTDHPMAPYFRDVLDHLIRVADSADSLRDRLTAVSELYVASLDNRLNVIMKQFTVIAGIFLPLTWLVGVFGQNFDWMVEHVDSGLSFAIWGVALPVVIVIGLLGLFRRLGFFAE